MPAVRRIAADPPVLLPARKIFDATGGIAKLLRTAEQDGTPAAIPELPMTRASCLLPALLLACALPAAAAEQRVFRDDFSDRASGWVDTQVADHRAKGIALYDGTGGYQMTPVDDATYGVMLAPRQASGPDVRIDAALFLYTGVGQGTGGVVCRHQDNDNFYAFMVSGSHGAGILKVKDGHATTLARAGFEGAMPNIADVRIGARCDGASLQLLLDGEVIAEATDDDLAAGGAGLVVMGERMAGTSAVFDDFALYQLAP
jgi:hypothetical protein